MNSSDYRLESPLFTNVEVKGEDFAMQTRTLHISIRLTSSRDRWVVFAYKIIIPLDPTPLLILAWRHTNHFDS